MWTTNRQSKHWVIDAEGKAIDRWAGMIMHWVGLFRIMNVPWSRDSGRGGEGATIDLQLRRPWVVMRRPVLTEMPHGRPITDSDVKKCTYGRPPLKYVDFDHRYLGVENELQKNAHH